MHAGRGEVAEAAYAVATAYAEAAHAVTAGTRESCQPCHDRHGRHQRRRSPLVSCPVYGPDLWLHMQTCIIETDIAADITRYATLKRIRSSSNLKRTQKRNENSVSVTSNVVPVARGYANPQNTIDRRKNNCHSHRSRNALSILLKHSSPDYARPSQHSCDTSDTCAYTS